MEKRFNPDNKNTIEFIENFNKQTNNIFRYSY